MEDDNKEMEKFVQEIDTLKERIFEYMDDNYSLRDKAEYRPIIENIFNDHEPLKFMKGIDGKEIICISNKNEEYRLEISGKSIDLIPHQLGKYVTLLKFDNYQSYLRDRDINILLKSS